MKRMWIAGVLAFAIAALAATPAAAAGGNSANAKLCQKSGWKTLFRSDGSKFANQGACVSYGAKGNTILTEPPNPWKTACEQDGIGRFEVHDTTAFGVPLTPPAFAYWCVLTSGETWFNVLRPVCEAFPDFVSTSFEDSQIQPFTTADCVRSGTT